MGTCQILFFHVLKMSNLAYSCTSEMLIHHKLNSSVRLDKYGDHIHIKCKDHPKGRLQKKIKIHWNFPIGVGPHKGSFSNKRTIKKSMVLIHLESSKMSVKINLFSFILQPLLQQGYILSFFYLIDEAPMGFYCWHSHWSELVYSINLS